MDWQTILTDAGTIAWISSALVVAIQLLKVLYYKLPWGWVQKTPGEIWFALSIAVSIAVAVALNFNVFLDTGTPLMTKFGTVFYGLSIGAGSKVIHSVASSAGAKLGAIKANSNNSLTAVLTGKACEETSQEVPVVPQEEPVVLDTIPAVTTPEPITQTPITPEITLVKRMKDNEVYVIIDGVEYKVQKRLLELDLE